MSKQIDLNKLCFLPGALLPLSDGKYNYINLLKQGLTNLGVIYQTPSSPTIPSIPANEIVFGMADGSNLMTSSSRLTFNESGQAFVVRNTKGSQILNADFGGSEYWIGDKNNDANGNHLYLNDAANFGYYDNTAHTGLFGINTSTPTDSLDVVGNIKFESLAEYANNAAAISGGLSVGNLYYTDVAGDGVLKIVI